MKLYNEQLQIKGTFIAYNSRILVKNCIVLYLHTQVMKDLDIFQIGSLIYIQISTCIYCSLYTCIF